MKKLAVYGAGGFGRETILMIEQMNVHHPQWDIIGFFDDGVPVGKAISKWRVLGGINEVNRYTAPLDLAIAIADGETRRSISEKIKNGLIHFPVLIHPMSLPGDNGNQFARGCIVAAGVILTTEIQLEEFSIINLSCTIGHNVVLGKYSSIMPGCNISGNVKIGDYAMIGTGAQILQNITLGKKCKIGAGAVVTKDIGEGKTAIGMPAHEH